MSSGATHPLPLLGAGDVRRLAADLGVRPTKHLGQNFVVDANTVRRIVRLAEVGRDDVVLEVGPGLGSLTLALLDAAASVVAVEIDPVLAESHWRTDRRSGGDRTPPGRLHVVRADAVRLAAPTCRPRADRPTALVANLPYNVAVPVLLVALERLPSLRHGLVMVQAEVAERLAARPAQSAYGAAVGQGRLVRRGAPGRLRAAQRVLAGAQRRLRPGRLHPTRPARRGSRGGVRLRRRGVRPAPQDAARGAGRLGRLGASGPKRC